MGWHDNAVHAWAWEPSEGDHPWDNTLILDLDYIVEWVHPGEAGGHFTFSICPATLVFRNANDLKFDAEESGGTTLQIDSIEWTPETVPSGAPGFRRWVIQGHNFYAEFQGQGFEQYLRMPPMHCTSQQYLSLDERGGRAFAQQGFPIP
jgi:hypothetical protein